MRKALVIARREFIATVRTKIFILSIVLMPVLMAGGLIAEVLFREFRDLDDRTVAVIDRTAAEGVPAGMLRAALEAAATQRNEEEIYTDPFGITLSSEKKQRRPRFVVEAVEAPGGDSVALAETRVALSERVRNKELFAFVEIEPGALEGAGAIYFFSDNIADDALRGWTQRTLDAAIRAWRVERTGLPPDTLAWATAPNVVALRGLSSKSASGEISETATEANVARMISALVMLGLIFFSVMFATMPLVHSTVEEKMQRIAEVLLGSIPPFQLMLGKLLGAVAVSLVIVSLYLGGAVVVALQFGYGDVIGAARLVWFFLFLVLAVTMFGALLLALGSAVSDMKEAQSAVMPVSILMSLPAFVVGPVLQAPDGTLSLVLSLFPLTAPTIMTMRLGLDPGMPLWQPLVAVLGALATTLFAVWAAGRIFRVGMLMTGKRPSYKEMLRWIASA